MFCMDSNSWQVLWVCNKQVDGKLNELMFKQTDRHFADGIFRCIFSQESDLYFDSSLVGFCCEGSDQQ